MKKVFLNLFFIVFILSNLNHTYSYDVIDSTKKEMDSIKCDLNYTGEMRQGYSYTFSDNFSNYKNKDLKIEEVKIHTYEKDNYNDSNDILNFTFTDWISSKNNILVNGDTGKVVESTNSYQIVSINSASSKEDFKITYTAKYYTKNSSGNFANGPYYHTECKDYKVVGCGDGFLDVDFGEKCDPNDQNKENWGNKGCTNTCEPNNESFDEYEKDIKQVIFKYKVDKIKLEKKENEENEKGTQILSLPKILPKTGTPISDRVKKIDDSSLDLDIITSRFKLAGSNNNDLDFWKTTLDIRDRDAEKYIIIPSSGLVIPVNTIPTNYLDYRSLINGKEIDVNKYLKTGSMEYPGTSTNGFGEVGNKVIFAHSSHLKTDNGRYKTDFQKIIELDSGEEIWIYEKINGTYKRFKYKTIESYETNPNDVGILNSGIGKNLTLFTCTPIGGIEARWVVKAKYIDDEKKILEERINFTKVNTGTKSKIDSFIDKISKTESEEKKEKILKIFKFFSIKEKTFTSEKLINIVEYLKYKLAIEYYK